MNTIQQKFMLTVLRLEQNYYHKKAHKETTERLGQYIVNNINKEEVYDYYKNIIEVDCKNKWDELFYEENYEKTINTLVEVCNEYRND